MMHIFSILQLIVRVRATFFVAQGEARAQIAASSATMIGRCATLMLLLSAVASGCGKDKEPSNPPEPDPKDDFEEAGESFKEGFKKTGQGIKKGVEQLGDEIEEATDKAAPDDDDGGEDEPEPQPEPEPEPE